MRASSPAQLDPVFVSAHTLERAVRAPNPASRTRSVGDVSSCSGGAACCRLLSSRSTFVESIHNGHAAWAIDFNGNFRLPAQGDPARRLVRTTPAKLARVREAVAAGHQPIEIKNGVFATYPAPSSARRRALHRAPRSRSLAWLWVGLPRRRRRLSRCASRACATGACTPPPLMAPPVATSLFFGSRRPPPDARAGGLPWRWRDHAGRAGAALGAIIALKLVGAAARRLARGHAALALAGVEPRRGGLSSVWSCWAAIGFDGLAGYPHLLSLLTDIESTRGYSGGWRSLSALGARRGRCRPHAVCVPGCAWPWPLLWVFVSRRGCVQRTPPRLPARCLSPCWHSGLSCGSTPSRCCSSRWPCCARG